MALSRDKGSTFRREDSERPTEEEVISMLLRHAQLSVKYKGEKMGIREMQGNTQRGILQECMVLPLFEIKLIDEKTLEALRELLMR